MKLDENIIRGFSTFLRLELSLSDNTVEAYRHDIEMFKQHLTDSSKSTSIEDICQEDIEGFLSELYDVGLCASSQARILSGLNSF